MKPRRRGQDESVGVLAHSSTQEQGMGKLSANSAMNNHYHYRSDYQ